ncbi:amidohydrolase family protein [Congregibacter sp.]|uniref:amidohydrolase family protein n=1 Tax=Congregibacter sp. TaxID=2744308 RepID=UPI0039E3A526
MLTNANIIDGTGSPVLAGMNLRIVGRRIDEIAAGLYEARGDEQEIVDLAGAYLVPGFWNMHTHLTALLPHNHALDDATHGAKVVRAGVNAMEGLRFGFTAVRSVGEEDYIDVTWQRVFDEGFMLGPRVFASGEPVSPTAGHRGATVNGVDGVAAVRKAVRTRIQRGASVIKIHNVEMFADELKAAVLTAHSLGVTVTSHSREPYIGIAVDAGIDSIEHGYGLSESTIRKMALKGTYYVPTIICNLSDRYIREREARLASLGYAEDDQSVRLRTAIAYADERSQTAADVQRDALRKAAKAGVKLMIGSDSMPIGEQGWLEMEQFVLSGVSEMDTLVAATRNPAEFMGVLDDLGTVEEGKLADLVVLESNPLENISNIRTVKMVFKDGINVDLKQPPGTLRFYDYFDSIGAPGTFVSRSETSAGFVRDANPYGN